MKNRNSGLDLYRILAMVLVAQLHVLYNGGLLGSVRGRTP